MTLWFCRPFEQTVEVTRAVSLSLLLSSPWVLWDQLFQVRNISQGDAHLKKLRGEVRTAEEGGGRRACVHGVSNWIFWRLVLALLVRYVPAGTDGHNMQAGPTRGTYAGAPSSSSPRPPSSPPTSSQ